MTRYMLDTNICIAVMKKQPDVRNRIETINPAFVGISGIVLAELTYGVYKSAQYTRNAQALEDFCSMCQVWDWPVGAADTYGVIRTSLEQQGRTIGANDLLIAAHATYLHATLVTNNTREFERISDLHIQDWTS